jgi:predicted HTH transcriptional regulator
LGLNERQRQAIEYIQEHSKITKREYQELGKVSHEMAHRELSILTAKGLIEKRGAGRWIHYMFVDD